MSNCEVKIKTTEPGTVYQY